MAHYLTEQEKQVDVQMGSSAPSVLDPEIRKLAEELSTIHGTVRITRESNGVHLYMACPNCLETYGSDELFKMHLAINAEKYLTTDNNVVGMCMKEGDKFNVLDLKAMPPLNVRGHEHKPAVVMHKEANEKYLEPDQHGVMVPKSPGKVIPVQELTNDHPAIMYLNSRNFDVSSLADQFRLSYCEQERDDIFYRKLPGGFRATPQGRLVFYIVQKGVVVGWQARILEIVNDGLVWYWHPYKKSWTPVLQTQPDAKPSPLPGWEEWDPAKYILAHGCARNECLMGYDAAVAYNVRTNEGWCGLAEGPLDAGRCGAPIMATMGKFFSESQARLIKDAGFSKVIYIADSDAAGEKGKAYVWKQFQFLDMASKLIVVNPPAGYKDLGEMPDQNTAREYILSHL
jgi:hypothetical protein